MLQIIKPFIIWALYPAIVEQTGNNHLLAAAACLILIVVIAHDNLRRGFLIDWTAFTYFVVVILLSLTISDHWIVVYPMVAISLAYTLASGLSLLFRQPYTLQYAKSQTSPEVWSDPHFITINFHLTGIWTVIFLLCFLLSLGAALFDPYWPIFVLVRNCLIAVGLVIPEQYPRLYLEKVEAKQI